MPVVIFLLARLGVVSTRRLAGIRKFMLIGCMTAAAIITPTPDPFNMLLVAIPMYLLYEFGIILARLWIPAEIQEAANAAADGEGENG
jgi:sec-independent protein translocase protein TatC